MSEHDVTGDKIGVWNKAPAHARNAGIVEFIDIRRGTIANPVFLSAVAANDVEMSFCIKLRALLRRQPLPEEF